MLPKPLCWPRPLAMLATPHASTQIFLGASSPFCAPRSLSSLWLLRPFLLPSNLLSLLLGDDLASLLLRVLPVSLSPCQSIFVSVYSFLIPPPPRLSVKSTLTCEDCAWFPGFSHYLLLSVRPTMQTHRVHPDLWTQVTTEPGAIGKNS